MFHIKVRSYIGNQEAKRFGNTWTKSPSEWALNQHQV
jgi:hypothetical protein